jgi:hypothetical protein
MDLRGVSPQEGERCALTVVLADTLAVFRAYQPVYRQAVVSAVVRAFKGSGHTPYYIMVDGEGQDEATICTTCVPHGNPNLDGLLVVTRDSGSEFHWGHEEETPERLQHTQEALQTIFKELSTLVLDSPAFWFTANRKKGEWLYAG